MLCNAASFVVSMLTIMSDLRRELVHTADHLVKIAEQQGIYFAIAFLYDASYDENRIKKLLPILQKQKGAIKNVRTI